MKKAKQQKTSPEPSQDKKSLKEVDFHINEFGEIVRDVKTEEINRFLDKHVPDKKFTQEEE
jgi:hypothetical protein